MNDDDSATFDSQPVPGPWKVLVVTEGRVEQKLLLGLLTRHHHQVAVSESGENARDQVRGSSFDVLLIDAMLPDMDGEQLIREVRSQLVGAPLPIFVLLIDELQKSNESATGADLLVPRPFDVPAFHAEVAAEIGRRKEHSLELSNTVDWQVALDAVGGRRDLLHELIDVFFIEYPPTLDSIRQAIGESDGKGLRLAAHKLKGCLRYFGPTHACELAKQLEEMGRTENFSRASDQLTALLRALEEVLPQLRKE